MKALKKTTEDQVGLRSLPRAVRKKMGYMKNGGKMYNKGGSVKDACYRKVKAGEKVFPSAYASGRIAKCRKMGASNYGKSKKN
jgi:hypothetical protein